MAGLTPDWMPELFFCHRYEFAFIADFLGYRIGTRADQVDTNRVHEMLDDDIEVDFVDNNFKNPDRDRLETIVSLTETEFVVLPDIDNGESLEDIVSYGTYLADEYDTTPIVVPKDDLDYSLIPSEWILGFSVPSGYGETNVPVENFTSHRVHLLGGSPRNQIKFANKLCDVGAEVYSVDGNSFAKGAGFGNIINEPLEMIDESGELDGNAWDSDVDGYTDWGQRIVKSLARNYELWRQWSIATGRQETEANTVTQ